MPIRGKERADPPAIHDDFSIQVPEYYNFGHDDIDRQAEEDPAKLAMLWVNQQGLEKRYSFGDLKSLSDRTAWILRRSGIRREDRVFIMLPRIPDWWILIIALIKLGAVYCPAPTILTPKDIQYRLNAGRFRMVVTDVENAPKVLQVRDACPSVSACMAVDGEVPAWIDYRREMESYRLYPKGDSSQIRERTRATDPLLIFFTSGTTGNPKMVLHDHSYPLGHIVTARIWQDLGPSDLHFTISDTGWAKSAWGNLFGQWIEGAAVFIYDIRGKFNAAEIPPLLEKYPVTTFCCAPTIYRMLVLEDLGRFRFPHLRRCLSAGEPLNPEVIRTWKKKTGLDISEGYGQTETVLCIGTFPGMEGRPGSMGRPAPGWRIELHDTDGHPVGLHREGRIAIATDPRPVGLFAGYLENEEATRKAFVRGWYYTDDTASMDEDGYLWYIGRDDDVIKSSGYRIGPFEVESALMEHKAVAEAAVVGSPHPLRGQIVKAFVVLKPGFGPSESLASELREHVKRVTAPYKYPRAIEFVEKLPKTLSGKIRRNELREREMQKGR